MKDRVEDVEHLVAEAQHRDLMADVARWFERDYLARTNVERFWLRYLVIGAAVVFLLHQCRSDWQKEARNDFRDELAHSFCLDPAKSSPVCEELQKTEPVR